jgi:hypothetical protein
MDTIEAVFVVIPVPNPFLINIWKYPSPVKSGIVLKLIVEEE